MIIILLQFTIIYYYYNYYNITIINENFISLFFVCEKFQVKGLRYGMQIPMYI